MPTSLASTRRIVPGKDPAAAVPNPAVPTEHTSPRMHDDAHGALQSPRRSPHTSPSRQDTLIDLHATPSMRAGKKKVLMSRLRGFEVLRWGTRRVREDCYLEFKLVSNPTKGHAVPALLQSDCAWRDDDNRPISKALGVLSVNYNFRDVGTTMLAKVMLSKHRVEWYRGHFVHDSTFVGSHNMPHDAAPLTPAFSVFGRDVRVEIADITQWFKADSKTPLLGPAMQPAGWWAGSGSLDDHAAGRSRSPLLGCHTGAVYASAVALKPIPSMKPPRRSRSNPGPMKGEAGFAPAIMARSESTPTLWDVCNERLGRQGGQHLRQLQKSSEIAARCGTRTPSPLRRHHSAQERSVSASSHERGEERKDTFAQPPHDKDRGARSPFLGLPRSVSAGAVTRCVPALALDAAAECDTLDSTMRSVDSAGKRPLVPTLSLLELHGGAPLAGDAPAMGSAGGRGAYDMPYVVSEVCTTRSKQSSFADDVSSTTAASTPLPTARGKVPMTLPAPHRADDDPTPRERFMPPPPNPLRTRERGSSEADTGGVTVSSFGPADATLKDALNDIAMSDDDCVPPVLVPPTVLCDSTLPTKHRIRLLGEAPPHVECAAAHCSHTDPRDASVSADAKLPVEGYVPRMPSPPSGTPATGPTHAAQDDTPGAPGAMMDAGATAIRLPAAVVPLDSTHDEDTQGLEFSVAVVVEAPTAVVPCSASARTPRTGDDDTIFEQGTATTPTTSARSAPRDWRRNGSPRAGAPPRTPRQALRSAADVDGAAVPQSTSELPVAAHTPRQKPRGDEEGATCGDAQQLGVPLSSSFSIAAAKAKKAPQTPPAARHPAPVSPACTRRTPCRIGSAVAVRTAERVTPALRRSQTATPPRRVGSVAALKRAAEALHSEVQMSPPHGHKDEKARPGPFWSFLERQNAYARQKEKDVLAKTIAPKRKGIPKSSTPAKRLAAKDCAGRGMYLAYDVSENRSRTCEASQRVAAKQQATACVQHSEIVREVVSVVRTVPRGGVVAVHDEPALSDASPITQLSPSVERLDLWSPSQALSPSFNFPTFNDAVLQHGKGGGVASPPALHPLDARPQAPQDIVSPCSAAKAWSPEASSLPGNSFNAATHVLNAAGPAGTDVAGASPVRTHELQASGTRAARGESPPRSDGGSMERARAAEAALECEREVVAELRAQLAAKDGAIAALEARLAAQADDLAAAEDKLRDHEALLGDMCIAVKCAVAEVENLQEFREPTFELLNHHTTLASALAAAVDQLPAPLTATIGETLRAQLARTERLSGGLGNGGIETRSCSAEPETATSRALFATPGTGLLQTQRRQAVTVATGVQTSPAAGGRNTADVAAATTATPVGAAEMQDCDVFAASEWAERDDVAALRGKLVREQSRRVAALKEAGVKDVRIKELTAKVGMLETMNSRVQAEKEEQWRAHVDSLEHSRSGNASLCSNDAEDVVRSLRARAEAAEALVATTEATVQELTAKLHTEATSSHLPKPPRGSRSPLSSYNAVNKTFRTSSSLSYSTVTGDPNAGHADCGGVGAHGGGQCSDAIDAGTALHRAEMAEAALVQAQADLCAIHARMTTRAEDVPGAPHDAAAQREVALQALVGVLQSKLAAAEAVRSPRSARLLAWRAASLDDPDAPPPDICVELPPLPPQAADATAASPASKRCVVSPDGSPAGKSVPHDVHAAVVQRAARLEHKLAAAERQIIEKLEEVVSIEEHLQEIKDDMTHAHAAAEDTARGLRARIAHLEAELARGAPGSPAAATESQALVPCDAGSRGRASSLDSTVSDTADTSMCPSHLQTTDGYTLLVAAENAACTLRKECGQLRTAMASTELQLHTAEQDLRRAAARNATLDAESQDLHREIAALNEHVAALEAGGDAQAAQRLENENEILRAECGSLHADCAALRQQLQQQTQALRRMSFASPQSRTQDACTPRNGPQGGEAGATEDVAMSTLHEKLKAAEAVAAGGAHDFDALRAECDALREQLAQQAATVERLQEEQALGQRMAAKYASLAEGMNTVQAALDDERARSAQLYGEKTSLERDCDKLRQKYELLAAEIADLTPAVDAASAPAAERDGLEAECRVLRAQSMSLRHQLDHQTEVLHDSQQELEESTQARSANERNVTVLTKDLDAARTRCSNARLEAEQLRKQLQVQNQKLQQQAVRQSQSSCELADLRVQLSRAEAEVERGAEREGRHAACVLGVLVEGWEAEAGRVELSKRMALLEAQRRAVEVRADAAQREAVEGHVQHELRVADLTEAARKARDDLAVCGERRAALEARVGALEAECGTLQQLLREATERSEALGEAQAALLKTAEEGRAAKVEAERLTRRCSDLEVQFRVQSKAKRQVESNTLFLTPEKKEKVVRQQRQDQLVMDLRKRIRDLEAQTPAGNEDVAALEARVADLTRTCEALEASVEAKAAETAGLRDVADAAAREVASLEVQLRQAERRPEKKNPAACQLMADLRVQRAHLDEEAVLAQQLRERVEALEAAVADAEQQRDAAVARVADAEGQLQLLSGAGGAAVEDTALRAEVCALRAQLAEADARHAALAASHEAAAGTVDTAAAGAHTRELEDRVRQQGAELARLRVALEDSRDERGALQARGDELRGELRAMAESCGALEARLAHQEGLRAALQKELQRSCEKIAAGDAAVSSLTSKLSSLTRERAAMQDSVREALVECKRNQAMGLEHSTIDGSLDLSVLDDGGVPSRDATPVSGRSQRRATAVVEAERLLQEYEALHDAAPSTVGSVADGASSATPTPRGQEQAGDAPLSARQRRFF